MERELSFEVIHASQLISSYLMDGVLSLREGIGNITYHDPCELARKMDVIEEPRFILGKLGLLKEVEKRAKNPVWRRRWFLESYKRGNKHIDGSS